MYVLYLVTQLNLTLWNPWAGTHQGPLSMGILQARILEWIVLSSSRGSSKPRDWTQVSRIAGRLFTAWAPGKPKNTGVGSLSLLQGIFPTQELNQGLLHYRWILYQLSTWEAQTHVYIWVIHVVVWQKPTQYCKATILRLKILKIYHKQKQNKKPRLQ